MNLPQTISTYRVTHRSRLVACGSRQSLPAVSQKSHIAVLLLLAVLLSGCGAHRASAPAGEYYYVCPDKSLTTISRAAIVELQNDSSHPEISADITEALFRALQKKQIFGLTLVRQNDPSWRSLQLQQDTAYTLEQILAIREALKCDGVLVGTITEFRPYPRMVVGLRLELIDLRDGQLLWALEQVWDSTDKETEDRIKKYFKSVKRSGFAPSQEWLASVSPLEFIKFVSHEVAGTL
jgi:hypothetical protein